MFLAWVWSSLALFLQAQGKLPDGKPEAWKVFEALSGGFAGGLQHFVVTSQEYCPEPE